MLSGGSKDSGIIQLKQIINGKHTKEMQLGLLKEFETCKSLTEFMILPRICELVPLTTSIQMIGHIISAFVRRLVMLLDERNVLQNTELSKKVLECLKSFWSLCSRQQNVVSQSQLFGKWHPKLLEEITPLASVFIDLFISANGHKEDQVVWSRRLYSWLNFDLPDRAIKIALLEAEGHKRDEAEIAGPLVSQVLRRKFDESSNPDYLLHFLLLKKWQRLAALSEITETSKFLKAPPSFLTWLQTYWNASNDYIPDDTTLKGAAVSQLLLRLNTDDVLDSLTDALQMAVFPEDAEYQPESTNASDNVLFIVDTKGNEHINEIKMNEGEVQRDEGNRDNRSPVQSGRVQGQSLYVDDRKAVQKRKRNVEEDSDDKEDEEEELKPKRLKHNKDISDDVDEDSETDDRSVKTGTLRPKNMAAAVLQRKNILIKDPVASSYFCDADTTTVAKDVKRQSTKSADVSSPVRSSPRLRRRNEGSPSVGQVNSTPQKTALESPKSQNRIRNLKSQEGNESPLVRHGNESPRTKKASSTPQNSAQKKSAKKLKMTS